MPKKLNKTIIGLDVGGNSLKMVKGVKDNGTICVLDFANLTYSAQDGISSVISSDVPRLLNSVLDAKKDKKADMHVTISGRNLCIRVVSLPILPRDELYQAVRSKIRKYISSELDQIVFSFAVLGEVQEKEINKSEVVFAAIQKQLFDKYLQSFETSGFRPKIITPSFFASWNLIRKTSLIKGADSLMVINIEKLVTDLTVSSGGRFVFTRNISLGGKDLLDASGAGRLSQKEGEVLCKEIELTAYHYYQIAHGRKVDKAIIIGEGSQISGLIDFVKQKLEIPVETLRSSDLQLELPTDKKEEFNRDISIYAQALGALLSDYNDINLLVESAPQDRRAMSPMEFLAPSKVISGAIVFFVLLVIITFVLLKGFNIYYKYQIESHKKMQEGLEMQTIQLMQIKKKMNILENEKNYYLELVREYPYYSVIITEISKAIPGENIVLDELIFLNEPMGSRIQKSASAPKFTIKGSVWGKMTVNPEEVTIFVLTLEQSRYFENVSVAINESGLSGEGIFDNSVRDIAFNAQASQGTLKKLSFTINGDIRLED